MKMIPLLTLFSQLLKSEISKGEGGEKEIIFVFFILTLALDGKIGNGLGDRDGLGFIILSEMDERMTFSLRFEMEGCVILIWVILIFKDRGRIKYLKLVKLDTYNIFLSKINYSKN